MQGKSSERGSEEAEEGVEEETEEAQSSVVEGANLSGMCSAFAGPPSQGFTQQQQQPAPLVQTRPAVTAATGKANVAPSPCSLVEAAQPLRPPRAPPSPPGVTSAVSARDCTMLRRQQHKQASSPALRPTQACMPCVMVDEGPQ